MNNESTNTAKDPRCPVCGNAVIGAAVYGNEGAYHPECTRPPLRYPEPVCIPVPAIPYVNPFPMWPNITCQVRPC